MNIGKESETSINESNSVSILKTKLQSSGYIKCYFGEGDKTPNTDGFFVINNDLLPLKEIHVQIKHKKELAVSNNQKVYQCDTKFINYANLGVTENPCMIFIVEIKTKRIFFKYLSDEFLRKNNFLNNNQKSVLLHFSESEEVIDNYNFYSLILSIIKDRQIKRFSPKDVNLLEFQNAFNILNNFFDGDFCKLKSFMYPNVWKFGIAYEKVAYDNLDYQRIKHERANLGINTAPYVSSFGAYAIEYGDNQQVFQNIDVFSNVDNLKFVHSISSTNGIPLSVEEIALRWLHSTFKSMIIDASAFIRFFPDDALFEIIFNFLDNLNSINSPNTTIRWHELNTIATAEAKDIIINSYPYHNYSDKTTSLLIMAILEIERRGIETIKRIWIYAPISSESIFDIIKNTTKLFQNMPLYYNDFITRLFGNFTSYFYSVNKRFLYAFDISLIHGIFKNEYKCLQFEADSFVVDVQNTIPKDSNNIVCRGCGRLHTLFNGKKANIFTNILSILYKQTCAKFNFQQDRLLLSDAHF